MVVTEIVRGRAIVTVSPVPPLYAYDSATARVRLGVKEHHKMNTARPVFVRITQTNVDDNNG